MIDNVRKKLNSNAGESIGETLVGLLIAALALVMLAGAMTAASSAVLNSKKKLEGVEGDSSVKSYYSESANLMELGSGTDATITIKGTNLQETVTIVYKENKVFETKPVIAYKKK